MLVLSSWQSQLQEFRVPTAQMERTDSAKRMKKSASNSTYILHRSINTATLEQQWAGRLRRVL